MSIPVTCDRCLQSFRVKDEFAGRTIRCKDCGAAMTVPWNGERPDGEIVPSRPRKRKKRPSPAPKIAAIVVGSLFGISILGTGVWFAVKNLRDSGAEVGSGKSDARNDSQATSNALEPKLLGRWHGIVELDPKKLQKSLRDAGASPQRIRQVLSQPTSVTLTFQSGGKVIQGLQLPGRPEVVESEGTWKEIGKQAATWRIRIIGPESDDWIISFPSENQLVMAIPPEVDSGIVAYRLTRR